jgi:hypothetical protein
MRPISTMALCLAAVAGAPRAALAADEEPRSPPVVVTAPIDQKVWEAAAPKFIESHSEPTFISEHLARWRIGLCPVTRGLSPAFNAFVSARVREVASDIGAPIDDPQTCRKNVEVIFTPEPQKLLEEVVKDHEILLGFHWVSQTKKVATVSRPIQSWYVTTTVAPNGLEEIDDQLEFLSPPVPGGALVTGSRIPGGPPARIIHALVVVDSKKVDGYTIGSVSDYVAMLALSQPRSADDCSELPSILDLFSRGCEATGKTDALSDVDRAYLKALYVVEPTMDLTFQRGSISRHMRQYLHVGK